MAGYGSSPRSPLNGVIEPVILATSAVREAENGSELEKRVVNLMGPRVRRISGEEEAALGFRGAISVVGASWQGPALVVDLGGGSAQLIVGEASSGPHMQVSLPLGTNRTTERFVAKDPPKKEELRALEEHVRELVPRWELSARMTVVAVGGSARAMLKITQDRLTVERLRRLAVDRVSLGGASTPLWTCSRAGTGVAGGGDDARCDPGPFRHKG